ncbi:hypothetical protein DCAR_0726930 [Daucus carota subsp. sativus]|uniref:Uncharacterized protein n=1 Tax=Daucus carota subsp. sativus TaxID=79200 RepID=A0AAF0XG90_DAUCS|nr:hypothetical protein DCAR_0726930 [Daucus carota subsp. sativus]
MDQLLWTDNTEKPSIVSLLLWTLIKQKEFVKKTGRSFTIVHRGMFLMINSKNFFSDTTKLIDLKHSSLGMDITLPELEVTRWPFFVFLGGSMFCLLSSSICHLFCCNSHPMNILMLRIDYVGIAVMIITSFFPPIYYIFQCSPHWQILYLSCITIMGIFTITSSASLFVAMGLFGGLVLAVHAMVVNWDQPSRNIILGNELAMTLSYLIGTLFYVTRIPERWRPGWFDLARHSHQIFHVFVIMGALSHYGAALVFLGFRSKIDCETNMSYNFSRVKFRSFNCHLFLLADTKYS